MRLGSFKVLYGVAENLYAEAFLGIGFPAATVVLL